jgi:hypothetical protein
MRNRATTCSSRRHGEVRGRQQDGNDAASMAGRHVDDAGLMVNTSIESTMSRICCKVIAGIAECRSRTDWS